MRGVLAQLLEHCPDPRGPTRRQPPQHRPPDEHRASTERQRSHHIPATAHPTIDEHLAPTRDSVHHLGKHLGRGHRAIELPAAMIGDDDPRRAGIEAPGRIVPTSTPLTSTGSPDSSRSHAMSSRWTSAACSARETSVSRSRLTRKSASGMERLPRSRRLRPTQGVSPVSTSARAPEAAARSTRSLVSERSPKHIHLKPPGPGHLGDRLDASRGARGQHEQRARGGRPLRRGPLPGGMSEAVERGGCDEHGRLHAAPEHRDGRIHPGLRLSAPGDAAAPPATPCHWPRACPPPPSRPRRTTGWGRTARAFSSRAA